MKNLLLSLLLGMIMGTLFGQPLNVIPDSLFKGEREPLSKAINSDYLEATPIISPDGRTLYFTRRYHPDNMGYDNNEDAWYATQNPDGSWNPAINMQSPINNEDHNSIMSALPDNNTLLLFGQYDESGSRIGSGVSLTNRNEKGWSLPENVKIDSFYHSGTWLRFFMCSDNRTLLMSIVGEEGEGDMDIYVSFWSEKNNHWTKPRNLGPTINTDGVDVVPFVAADNKTIYFSSSGHPGFGGNDLFMSRRLDESWTKWSEPINLGSKINTPQNEFAIFLPASGEHAYFSSYNRFSSSMDIYRIQMPEQFKPSPVVLISGTVVNPKTGEPLLADIVYSDLETGEEVGRARSSPVDGKYQIALPSGREYAFSADQEGYFGENQLIDLREQKEFEEIEVEIAAVPLEENATIELKNIFFQTARYSLKSTSRQELNRLLELLEDNPDLSIEVAGHTDSIGKPGYNQRLSENRAKSVVAYLLEKGIDTERLVAKGYGEEAPVASNKTEEGRAQNRRVEFKIISK